MLLIDGAIHPAFIVNSTDRKPRNGVARIVAVARERGLDDTQLFDLMTAPLGLRDEGRTLVDLLVEDREDEVVAAIRAAS